MDRLLDLTPSPESELVSRLLVNVHRAVDEHFPSAGQPSRQFTKTVFSENNSEATAIVPLRLDESPEEGPVDLPPPPASLPPPPPQSRARPAQSPVHIPPELSQLNPGDTVLIAPLASGGRQDNAVMEATQAASPPVVPDAPRTAPQAMSTFSAPEPTGQQEVPEKAPRPRRFDLQALLALVVFLLGVGFFLYIIFG